MRGPLTDFDSEIDCCDIKMDMNSEPSENCKNQTGVVLAFVVLFGYLGFVYNVLKWLHAIDNE